MDEKRSQGLHFFLIILVLIGAINWGLIGLFNFNLLHQILMKNTFAKKIVYTLIGIAGLYLALCRNTYFPQSGDTTFPTHLLHHCRTEKEGKKITIMTKYPNSHIVYWLNLNGDLSNSGTAKTDERGLTEIVVAEPKSERYFALPREAHYRAILDQGKLSHIETVNI